MNFFARLEAACANVVERAFATAFPSELQPVHIARKLVAAFESGPRAGERGGRRFVVRMSPGDFARFENDRPYLERQWSAMLARLAERSRRPQRSPDVRAEADPSVASGTVAIGFESLPVPVRLSLRVRRGVPSGARVSLDRALLAGRDADCALTLLDPRVSRKHFEIAPRGGALHLRDLNSSNGTFVNGERVAEGEVALGDVIVAGDSELVVDVDE